LCINCAATLQWILQQLHRKTMLEKLNKYDIYLTKDESNKKINVLVSCSEEYWFSYGGSSEKTNSVLCVLCVSVSNIMWQSCTNSDAQARSFC
jgi:hypothetical protein